MPSLENLLKGNCDTGESGERFSYLFLYSVQIFLYYQFVIIGGFCDIVDVKGLVRQQLLNWIPYILLFFILSAAKIGCKVDIGGFSPTSM